LAVLRNDFGLLARAERDERTAARNEPGDTPRSLSPPERAELLSDLDAQVAALADAVSEIVDLARGQTEPESPSAVELGSLVRRAVERTRGINPTVTVQADGPEVTAVVRPGVLERAVTNLVRNAVQVSGDQATVEVTWSHEAEAFVVEVLDRGPGLDPQETPHLFERFFRGAAARNRHGSGLGLAIVAQAATLHGGSVTAADRPGGGARFVLGWPDRD
jgi:two-component system sensor histidine kinase MprB